MRRGGDLKALSGAAVLAMLLLVALWVRLMGLEWDGLAALHPDERHVFFVTHEALAALRDPANAGLSLADWWLSEASPLNPHRGERSFVYGEAPLLAGVLTLWALSVSDWFQAMPVLRGLAALVDTSTVLAVFLAARMLAGRWAALLVAALYAAMPGALQLANFHTVDVWLSASVALALVPMVALAAGRPGWPAQAALAGGALGLAMACKVTGVLALAPLALALALAWRRGLSGGRVAGAALLALLAALVVVRLANPFAFAGPAIWGLGLSADWIADFRGLAAVTGSADFPPNWQWIAGYGGLRFLRDAALFGVGPVVVLLLTGLWRGVTGPVLVALAMALVFLALAMISSVSALRYAAPALPALAVALAPVAARLDLRQALGVLAVALWWGGGAVRLHDGWHPRIVASHWLWTLPRGTVLTNETAWDDPLPTIIALGDARRWPSHDDWFQHQGLDITAPDSAEKADRIAALLARTDYLILSSDRQSAVMPRLPDRFPLTTAHYAALFAGEACFAPVLVLDRGYPLPLFGFDDSWAQEPWRVYDHPVVRIFRREPCFDPAAYAAMLRAALAAN